MLFFDGKYVAQVRGMRSEWCVHQGQWAICTWVQVGINPWCGNWMQDQEVQVVCPD